MSSRMTLYGETIMETNNLAAFPELLKTFTILLNIRVGNAGWSATLLNWRDDTEGSLRIYTRRAGSSPEDKDWDSFTFQNYLSFPAADGTRDVLEAEVAFKNHDPSWTRMRLGVPASLIGKGRSHQLVLRFDGGALGMYVDGVLVDEDWPVGGIPMRRQAPLLAVPEFDGTVELVKMTPDAISLDELISLAGGAGMVARRREEILGPERKAMQYWTPPGHNQWVGDVMFGDTRSFDQDRLHLFYLIDRRHGASKFGQGGHFIAHLSTTDLVHWEHHPVAVGLEPWMTIGTGRPLVHDGKLLLGYGMHTSRIYPEAQTVTAAVDSDGRTTPRPFPRDAEALYPLGSTFAESTDGIQFSKSRVVVHPAQNPNILRDQAGTGFLMLAGYYSRGLWRSDELRHWQLLDTDVVPLWQPPERASDECQCMFEWNGWHYIVGGRTGFWMSRQQLGPYWAGPDGTRTGVVTPRWDIYDGLWVPMVAEFKNDRRILAGFLQGPGVEWAGQLVFRELVQLADGTLGLKWPDELRLPVRESIRPDLRVGGKKIGELTASVTGAADSWAEVAELPRSIQLTVRITPGPGTQHIAIAGLGVDGTGCALSLMIDRGRVQWNATTGRELPAAIPALAELPALERKDDPEATARLIPYRGQDFTLTGVEGLDHAVKLEMIFLYDAKSQSTIIDACLNRQRTLVTRRPGLILEHLRFMADGPATIENITIGRLG